MTEMDMSKEELIAYIRVLESNQERLEQVVAKQQLQLQNLSEMLVNSRRHTFGQSSEQSKYLDGAEQLNFFNEAEKEFNSGAAEPTEKTIFVPEHTRKEKRTKEELTANLPHYEVNCTLEGADKLCDICGTELTVIGKEKVRSELMVIPQQMAVIDYIRYSYKCAACEKETGETEIRKATAPVPVMKKSMAAPATVAYIMQEKYENAVPLYRQERYWKSKGVEINRNTLANWIVRSSRWFEPVCEQMRKELLRGDIVHADETEFQVLKEDGRKAEQKSRMWVFCSGKDEGKQLVLYHYATSRSGKIAADRLSGFKGYLQTDGYQGYNAVEEVIHVGCWAHARRKWIDCLPKGVKPDGSKSAQALGFVDRLFALEDLFKELPSKDREKKRAEQSKPVLDAYWALLEDMNPPQGSSPEKARVYSLNQRESLEAFLLDGRLELTNNRAERAVKPFVIGRKNFLFADTSRGADASARCYSMIQSAKMNNLDVYGYLLHLLTVLPKFGEHPSTEQISSVMPWSVNLPDFCRKGSLIETKNVFPT